MVSESYRHPFLVLTALKSGQQKQLCHCHGDDNYTDELGEDADDEAMTSVKVVECQGLLEPVEPVSCISFRLSKRNHGWLCIRPISPPICMIQKPSLRDFCKRLESQAGRLEGRHVFVYWYEELHNDQLQKAPIGNHWWQGPLPGVGAW